jgi:hypothetical protein
MPGPPTPILGLTVPTVGGDGGLWGTELNTDLAILDNLGAVSVVSTSANLSAAIPIFPEAVIKATGGVGGITITLPNPSLCSGKVFTVKKVDAGVGVVTIVPAVGLIDGAASYIRGSQYQYGRFLSDGTNYNVIGNN